METILGVLLVVAVILLISVVYDAHYYRYFYENYKEIDQITSGYPAYKFNIDTGMLRHRYLDTDYTLEQVHARIEEANNKHKMEEMEKKIQEVERRCTGVPHAYSPSVGYVSLQIKKIKIVY